MQLRGTNQRTSLLQSFYAAESGIERAVFANTFPPNDQISREHSASFEAAGAMSARDLMSRLREDADKKIVPAAGGSPLVRAYLLDQSKGRMSKDQFISRYACVLDSFDAPDPASKPLMISTWPFNRTPNATVFG